MGSKYRIYLIALAVVLGLSGLIRQPDAVAANVQGIAEVVDRGTMLMEDGSLWTNTKEGPSKTSGLQIVDVSMSSYGPGYGLTSDGRLVTWSSGTPAYAAGIDNLTQLSGSYGLRRDGTVWQLSTLTQMEQLSDVVMIGEGGSTYNEMSFPYLLSNGEVWASALKHRAFARFEDVSTVKMLAGDRYAIFVLMRSGEVLRYAMPLGDDPNPPEKIADNAAQIVFSSGRSSLLIVGSDGTVGEYINYESYNRQLKPVKGLSGIRQISGAAGAAHFYVQSNDGSWFEFKSGEPTPIHVPGVTKATLTLSSQDTVVGGTIKAKAAQTLSTGATVDVPFAKANIRIEKPYLLKKQDNGTFKGLGVGETQVTFTAGEQSQSVTVAVSLDEPLLGAKQIKGITMLPIKPVFQALGGTVAYKAATKTFEIRVGDQLIKLTVNSAKATINNKTVSMTAAVQTDGGETLFPAKLLTTALGASLKWNSSWSYMDIALGKASMSVYSDQTLKLIKRKEQGTLANLIGRTYWVNDFQGWERFIKLTVVDIVPDYKGYFSIQFRKDSGGLLETYTMANYLVTETLNNRSYFLNYDPYKKYKWSAATWKQIKAERVTMGMTKDQVRMSWGDPTSSSQISSRGLVIETWGFGLYNYVTFTNGKVTGIYTY